MESSPPWCLPYITPSPKESHTTSLFPKVVLFFFFIILKISLVTIFVQFWAVSAGWFSWTGGVCGGERDGCFQIWLWKSYIEFIQNFMVAPQNQDYPLFICFLVTLTRTHIWYVAGLVHMNAIIEWKICQKYMTLKNCLKDWFTQILTKYTVINGNHPL